MAKFLIPGSTSLVQKATMLGVSGLSLQWRHNERDGDPNHRRLDCLLNCLFRCRSNKTPKLRVTGTCEGNSPVTGESPPPPPPQKKRARDAESLSIWWRHHDYEKHIRRERQNKEPKMKCIWDVHHQNYLDYSFVVHLVQILSQNKQVTKRQRQRWCNVEAIFGRVQMCSLGKMLQYLRRPISPSFLVTIIGGDGILQVKSSRPSDV